MEFNPDQIVVWRSGPIAINATLVYTWIVMFLLAAGCAWVSARLSTSPRISRWQNLLEVVVQGIRQQIRDVSQQEPGPFTPFIGTLFLFIAVSNLLAVVPGFRPPTASMSTTVALAVCVLVAVPLFGIAEQGVWTYLRQYVQPTVWMLPFNLIGEASRTVALAIRLYGNIMSGSIIGAILLAVAPFFFPVVMQLFGLLTGLIQAYIFAVLAMVYIASAKAAQRRPTDPGRGDPPAG